MEPSTTNLAKSQDWRARGIYSTFGGKVTAVAAFVTMSREMVLHFFYKTVSLGVQIRFISRPRCH